jgi:hypothetical protein
MDFLDQHRFMGFRLLRAIQCIYSEDLEQIQEAIDLLQEHVYSESHNRAWDRLRHMGVQEADRATREAKMNPTPMPRHDETHMGRV